MVQTFGSKNEDLENKLLLISINFTPEITYVFQGLCEAEKGSSSDWGEFTGLWSAELLLPAAVKSSSDL